jgi:hypothetical protein
MTSRKYQPSFDELVDRVLDEAFRAVETRRKKAELEAVSQGIPNSSRSVSLADCPGTKQTD